jgi:two-component system, cell cycle sensor histidine kinase and response regulator CckA
MLDGTRSSSARDRLRNEAEAKLAGAAPSTGVLVAGAPVSLLEQTALLHELQVHQIELEMQNAQLLESRRSLEASLDRYRELYESAPVGFLTLDADGVITIGNRCAAEQLHVPPSQLAGHRLAAFLEVPSRVIFTTLLHSVFNGDGPQLVDLALRDGREPARILSVQAAREADGAECRVILVDVTAIREGERQSQLAQQVEFERQRLRLVRIALDGLIEEICVLDREGHILLDNAAWRARLASARVDGHGSHDAMAGEPFDNVWEHSMQPDVAEASLVRRDLHELLDGHTREFATQFPVRAGHETRWFRLQATRLNGTGPERVIVSQQDITTQHESLMAEARLADQLRESQKMEALGVLAGGIAHDFNNILSAILGNVSLARLAPHDELSMELSLDEIERAARRAADLVQQILTFSRRQPQHLATVALSDVVLDVARMLRVTIPTGVEIATRVEPDTPLVRGDVTQLHQVVINLCTNAWLAIAGRSGSAGHVTIHCDRFVVPSDHLLDASLPAALAAGTYTRLTVSDDGVGMDDATVARVFEPFFTTRPLGSGTGLGLSVVHGIVASHGGAITVQSTQGVGSAFTVYLPAVSAPADGVRAKASAATATPTIVMTAPATAVAHGTRVILVDDEAAVLAVMSRLLRAHGYAVSAFADPQRAVTALKDPARRVDLLVCDQNMPHLSGVEVARETHVVRPDLPVVIATGLFTEELREQAAKTGVYHLLNKPDIATDLVPLLESLRSRA